MKTISKLVLCSFLVLCTFIGKASATVWPACPACPTDVPPTSILWSSGSVVTTIVVGGHTCTVKICYCYRTESSTVHDYWISGIFFDVAGCKGTATSQDVVNAAFNKLFALNPAGLPCPPCPSTDVEWRENRGTCWSETIDPDTGIEMHQPCATRGLCKTRYNVCCNPLTGAQTLTKIGQTTDTKQCGSGCNEVVCP